jgi:hypothetical protein
VLYAFFHKQLNKFLEADLLPLGRQIIQCCLDRGSVPDLERLMPAE